MASFKKLDKKKLETYKKRLNALKENYVQDIKNMTHNTGETDTRDVSGHVLHMADVATDMYDKEFSLGLASNEREVLAKIEIALKRVGDQSFGQCVRCEKAIPQVRLNAIPYAETCLKCQEEIENER